MKAYVKPELEVVEIRSQESFASAGNTTRYNLKNKGQTQMNLALSLLGGPETSP